MKMKAWFELVVIVLLVLISLSLEKIVDSPLWIKYLVNTAEIVVILVAPGYYAQGLLFPELYNNFFIMRLAIASILSISTWIALVYLLDVFRIGINFPDILWGYSILCIGLAGLALLKTKPNLRIIKPQDGINGISGKESRTGRLLFFSIEVLIILGIVWLVGSIRTDAMSRRGYTEFYFTRETGVNYVLHEDSVLIIVPITIVNQEEVDSEYGILAEYNQESVGAVGSIHLAPGDTWIGFIEANIKNHNLSLEVYFLLARNEEVFPYRALRLKIDNIINDQVLDSDDNSP